MVARPPSSPIMPAPTSERCMNTAATATEATTDATRPPTKPDQVLLGENLGQSLGPFIALPTKKAPMSADQVTANSIKVHPRPWLVAISQVKTRQAGAI